MSTLPRNPLYRGTRYSKITHAPKGMLDRKSTDPVKLRWFAKNCDTLADFMETLQPERHDQGSWNTQTGMQAAGNVCGTAACALGWAAISQRIPGLQYAWAQYGSHSMPFAPTSEGEVKQWFDIGAEYFGYAVQIWVFNNSRLSRDAVVSKLRAAARDYRAGDSQPDLY